MFDDCNRSEGRGSAFEESLRVAIDRSYAGQGWQLAAGPHAPTPPLLDGVCQETADLRELLEAGAAHLAVAKRAAREQSRQAAVEARALAAFARCRPAAELDRSEAEAEVGAAAAASRAARPGVLTEVSEWAVDEVMASLGLSSRTAGQLLADSLTLVEQLPATLAALEAAVIGWPQARMLADVLGPLTDEVRAGVEADVLAGAAGKTVSALRAAAHRAVLRADAAGAAARLATAVRERTVRLYPNEDGMATLSAVMSAPVAAACLRALEAYADACVTPGDERSKGQRMVDCLAELILRPGEGGMPPVQVQLTLVAGVDTMRGGCEPGEVDGVPVPALLVRELAYTLGLLHRPEQPDGQPHPDREPEPGEPAELDEPVKLREPVTAEGPAACEGPAAPEQAGPEKSERPETPVGPQHAQPEKSESPEPRAGRGADPEERVLSANERAAVNLAALFRFPTSAGTELANAPAIAVVAEISGELLALTDAAHIRRVATCDRKACRLGREPCTHPPAGPGIGPPGASAGYAPSERLGAFVRARDRRCRFPGCRARAVRCDLDHNIPWPRGATSEDNLCCLCRHHHRLSHQAPGWALCRLDDGGLRWTMPGGAELITYPPPYGTDDQPPPTAPKPTATAPTAPSPTAPSPTPVSQRSRTLRERVLGRPREPGEPADDPPPF